jgi:hypothetical protein
MADGRKTGKHGSSSRTEVSKPGGSKFKRPGVEGKKKK